MKHAFIVHLYFPHKVTMPYLFTSENDAYAYGEYKFRTNAKVVCYEVERFFDIGYDFYKL